VLDLFAVVFVVLGTAGWKRATDDPFLSALIFALVTSFFTFHHFTTADDYFSKPSGGHALLPRPLLPRCFDRK
jgi:hypothetical protein